MGSQGGLAVREWKVIVSVMSGNYDGAALLKGRIPTSSRDRKD